ncbi:MAG: hypothetical protein ACKPJJ_35680, partial [Planctomycetaceae bacterium]
GFVAMQFDLDSLETVGLPFLQVAATMHVSLNVGLSLNSISAVNFRDSFGSKALFDLNADGDITVSELRKLHGAASYGSLYSAQDSAARVLSFSAVFAAIDSNHDNLLSISEAQTFMSA